MSILILIMLCIVDVWAFWFFNRFTNYIEREIMNRIISWNNIPIPSDPRIDINRLKFKFNINVKFNRGSWTVISFCRDTRYVSSVNISCRKVRMPNTCKKRWDQTFGSLCDRVLSCQHLSLPALSRSFRFARFSCDNTYLHVIIKLRCSPKQKAW